MDRIAAILSSSDHLLDEDERCEQEHSILLLLREEGFTLRDVASHVTHQPVGCPPFAFVREILMGHANQQDREISDHVTLSALHMTGLVLQDVAIYFASQ